MSVEMLIVFLVICFALVLFITEKFPVHITAMIILVVMMILGLNPFYPDAFPNVKEGLSGFSNEATVTVLAMFILSAGIQKTGIIALLGRRVFSFVGNSEIRQLMAIGIIVGPISGFINNTAAVAIMLPMVVDLANRSKVPATRLLIPLSFFGMLGGTLTLIGTSTNILAASLIKDVREIGIFEFLPLGVIVFCVGTIYMMFLGRYLLPARKNRDNDEDEEFDDIFLTEVVIERDSNLLGKSIKQSRFDERNDVEVVKLIREKKSYIKEAKTQKLEIGDILVLRASQQRILDIINKEGVKLLPNFDEDARKRPAGTGKIVKVIMRGVNAFHDRSLDEINFWRKYNAAVVGLQVPDITAQRLGSMKLRVGQILLVQASIASLDRIKYSKDFFLLETIEQEYNAEKMWMAVGIVTAVIIAAALLGVPIVVAALAGVLAMGLTRCINTNDMFDSVNWEVIFLLAGVIPIGIAMSKSGAADYLAGGLVGITDSMEPILILMIFYLVTTVLTEIISNNAAVVLMIPIAVSVSAKLGLDSFPFVLAVMFAASTSFLTPVGYQTNTMVYGAGNYKFSDFIKIGAPLNILLMLVTCYSINFFWPVG
jgi:di/tricarboxylate transporter